MSGPKATTSASTRPGPAADATTSASTRPGPAVDAAWKVAH